MNPTYPEYTKNPELSLTDLAAMPDLDLTPSVPLFASPRPVPLAGEENAQTAAATTAAGVTSQLSSYSSESLAAIPQTLQLQVPGSIVAPEPAQAQTPQDQTQPLAATPSPVTTNVITARPAGEIISAFNKLLDDGGQKGQPHRKKNWIADERQRYYHPTKRGYICFLPAYKNQSSKCLRDNMKKILIVLSLPRSWFVIEEQKTNGGAFLIAVISQQNFKKLLEAKEKKDAKDAKDARKQVAILPREISSLNVITARPAEEIISAFNNELPDDYNGIIQLHRGSNWVVDERQRYYHPTKPGYICFLPAYKNQSLICLKASMSRVSNKASFPFLFDFESQEINGKTFHMAVISQQNFKELLEAIEAKKIIAARKVIAAILPRKISSLSPSLQTCSLGHLPSLPIPCATIPLVPTALPFPSPISCATTPTVFPLSSPTLCITPTAPSTTTTTTTTTLPPFIPCFFAPPPCFPEGGSEPVKLSQQSDESTEGFTPKRMRSNTQGSAQFNPANSLTELTPSQSYPTPPSISPVINQLPIQLPSPSALSTRQSSQDSLTTNRHYFWGQTPTFTPETPCLPEMPCLPKTPTKTFGSS